MSVQLRSRKKSSFPAVEVVKQFDSFPKVDTDDFIERSSVGGVVSIIAYLIIILIIVFEVRYYYDSDVAFEFVPDTDFDAKLRVNLDITVAMPCHSIGADILDSTNQNFRVFGTLEEEDTWFEMTDEQKMHFEDIKYLNSYLREEFHAVNDLLWKSAHSFQPTGLPKRTTIPNQVPDACRVHGSLELNKVAGNLHITAGKSLQLADGHVHLPILFFQNSYNFSHRIHHLSFGDSTAGIIHPLDSDEKITENGMTLYQYFIEIVPTDVQTFLSQAKTYQYSVKDNMRTIDHNSGSHGVPGIYFKYDFSALKVIVSQTREPLFQLFMRLSSTVAGVFVTAGIISRLVQVIFKKFDFGKSIDQKVDHNAGASKTNVVYIT